LREDERSREEFLRNQIQGLKEKIDRAGRPILLPTNRSYWPGREFLAWHRQEHGFKTT
jgi:hypothetical protein